MEAVEEAAAAPPPIPFPWKRAVPGMVLAGGVLGWGAVELVRLGLPALTQASTHVSLQVPHLSAALNRPLEQAGWVAMALGVSLAGWIFSRRMAGGSGLL
jgi:hypothetical protein